MIIENKYLKTRKNLIYGNCKVFSIDNDLMFLCVEKKAQWYLDRNLAIIINENPLEIKLTFKANGKGWNGDNYYLSEKKNICCVCGQDELSKLTKHHIIPREFKQYLPDNIKSKSSHDIVPICAKCHSEYENYVIPFKTHLGEICGLDYIKMVKDYTDCKKAIKMAHMLSDNDGRINDVGRNNIIKRIKNNLKTNEIDLNSLLLIDESKIELEFNKKVIDYFIQNKSLQEFYEMWREHFIVTTAPFFMPDFWNVKRKIGNLNTI